MKNCYSRYNPRAIVCKLMKVVSIVLICLTSFLKSNAQQYYQPVYGSSQSSTTASSISNAGAASDGNLSTYSTLNNGGALLGSNTVVQNIIFSSALSGTTDAYVKMSIGSGVIAVLGSTSIVVQAYNGNTAVGTAVSINNTSLLGLLNGSNDVLIKVAAPGASYDRVRVSFTVSGLLSVGGSINIYEAYYLVPSTNPLNCDAPLDVLTGVSGLLSVTGNVTNAASAIDGNPATYATLNTGATVVGTIQETAIFSGLSQAGDQVRVTFSKPAAVIQLSALNNVLVNVYNGNTLVQSQSLSSLLSLDLLGLLNNGAPTTVTFTPTGQFDRVEFSFTSVASVLTTIYLNELQRVVANPGVTQPGAICPGSTATLNATTLPGTIVRWYTQATGGSPVATGTSYTTPALSSTTVYYVTAERTSGGTNCDGTESNRVPDTVNVYTAPALPAVTASVATVNTGQTATFTIAGADPTLTYNWYTTASGGSSIATGTSFTTPVITAATTYYVEAKSSTGCVSAGRTAVNVYVTTEPICSYATQQQSPIISGVCALCGINNPGYSVDNDYSNYSSLYTGVSALGSVSQLLQFSRLSPIGDSIRLDLEIPGQNLLSQIGLLAGITVQTYTGSTPNGDAMTLNSALVKLNLLGGTSNKFRITFAATHSFDGVSVGIAGAANLLSSLNVYDAQTIVPAPALTPGQVQIHANTQQSPIFSGVCALCSVTTPAQAVDADTSTYSTVIATVGALGYVGQLLQFPGSYNPGDSVQVYLEVPSQLITVQLLAGIQIQAYNGNTPVGSSFALNSSLVNLQLLAGSNKFKVKFAIPNSFTGISISISGAVSLLSSLRIYDAVVISTASNVINVCTGSTATVNVQSPTNATINWYTTATGGTPVAQGYTFTTPPVSSSTTYYIEAARSGCANPNRTVVTIVPNAIPVAPTVVPTSSNICLGDSATLNATAPTGVSFKWYTQPTGGTPFYTGTSYTATGLTATTSYYVEAVNNGCASASRTQNTITVNQPPANVAVAPPSATIGVGQTASFTASSTTSNVTFNWYPQATGGSPLASTASFTTPALTTSANFYLEAVSNAFSCKVATRLLVPVTVVGGGGNMVPCDAATSQTNTVNGICIGCAVTNPSLAVDTDTTTGSSLTILAGLLGGYAEQTLVFPFVANAGDSVEIGVTFPAALANVGVLSSLQVASYNGANYNNDRTAVANNALISLNLFSGNTQAVLKFAPSQAFDRIAIRLNSGAAGLLNAVQINYAARIKQAPTVSASSVNVCQGQQATFVSTAPANATFNWYSQPSGGIILSTGSSFTTGVLNDTTTYYAASVSSTGCVSPTRTPVTANVAKTPAVPVVTTSTVAVCSGTSGTFTVLNPSATTTYNWYDAATAGNIVGTGTTFTTPKLTANTTYYLGAVNGGTCPSVSRTPVNVTVNALPAAPTLATANTAVCSGGSTVLSVQNPQTGLVYNWYATSTGGSALTQGTNFTTPNLTTNTTYYVEAVNASGCVSSRDSVLVTVNPAPAAPTVTVVPASGNINAGGTATLTASSSSGVVSYNWYLTTTSGSPVFTGAAFTTPSLTSTTTYYVAAVSASGCMSTLVPVTITVTPNNNLTCDAPTSEAHTVSGLCLGCSVTNAGGAVDTDTTTYSSLNLAVGLLAGTVDQTLIFSDAGAAGDTVVVLMSTPGTLVSAGVLPAIQIQSYNGATANGDLTNLSNPLLNVQVLSPGSTFRIKFVPTQAFDRVKITLNAGVLSALSTLNIYYASKLVSAPKVTANSVNVCAGSPATLNATAQSDATIKWFDAASGGNQLAVGGAYVTPALTSTTTYYAQAERTTSGCANTNRIAVTAVVSPLPATPVPVNSSIALCAGNTATLGVQNPQAGITYNWYTTANGTTPAFTGSSVTTSAVTADTTYYVESVNATGCKSVRASVVITASAAPAAPTVTGAGSPICAGGTDTLNIQSPQTGITYKWYDAATGGNLVFTGSSFVTPALTSSANYYAEADNTTGCGSPRTLVAVSVNPVPTVPAVVSNNLTTCSGQPVTLNVQNPQSGVAYQWFASPTSTAVLFTGVAYTPTGLTSSTTFYVGAMNSTGCTSTARTSVSVTVNQGPATPALVNSSVAVCAGSTATLSVQSPSAGTTYNWYDAAVGGNLVYTGAVFNTPVLTGNSTYYLEAQNSTGCTSTRVPATITVNPAPAQPTVTVVPANATINAGQTAALTINPVTAGTTYNWYLTATGGVAVATGTSFTTPALSAGTTYYAEAVNSTGCSSVRTPVAITVNGNINLNCDVPTSQASSANGLCVGCSVTNQGGAVDADTTTASTLNMTVAVLGANVQQTLIFPALSEPGDTVTVVMNVPPAILAASVLSAIQINSLNGVTDNGDITTLSSSLVNLQVLTSGNTLRVKFAPTQLFDRIKITLNSGIVAALTSLNINYAIKQVAPPVVTTNTTNVCSGNPATLTATAPSNVTVTWYSAASGGSPLPGGTGTTFVTPALSATTVYYAQSARTSNGCANTNRVPVTVTVTPAPATPVLVNANPAICSGNVFTLAVQNPQTGITYQWYDAPTAGNLIFTGSNFTTPALTNTTTYYVTAVSATGNCNSSSRASATVTVAAPPATPTVTAGNVSVCSGGTGVLSIQNPQTGITYNWYDAATAGNLVRTGSSVTVGPITNNTVYYVEAVNAGGCMSASRATDTVAISVVPAAPQIAASSVSVCAGSKATFNIQGPQTGITYNWYSAATAGTLLATGTQYTTTQLSATTTYYAEAVNSTGCTSSSRTSATASVNAVPSTPVVNNTGTTICSGTATQLSIQNPVPNVTYNWYDSATGGNKLATGTSYTTPVLTANTTYYVEAVNATGCTSAARASVPVTINTSPADPVVVNNAIQVCSGSPASLTVQNPVTGITYTWYSTPKSGAALFTGTTYIVTPQSNNTTYYYLEAVSSGGCASSSRAIATVTVNQTPAAPTVSATGTTVCSGNGTTVSIQNPQNGYTYNWYDAATGGNLLFSGSSYSISKVTSTTTVYASASNGSCASAARTQVTIVVNATPADPIVAVFGTTACAGQPTTLTISNPQTGVVYNWYNVASGGSIIGTGSGFTTPAISTSTVFYVQAVSGTCISLNTTPVTVSPVQPPAAPVVASTGTSVCSGQATTLTISNPQATLQYNWYDAATGGNLLNTGTSYTTNPINANATYYVASAVATGCSSTTRTTVSVTANALPPTPAVTSANITVCQGAQTTLQVSNPQSGYTYNWSATASGGTVLFAGPSYAVNNITANVVYYVTAVNTTGCSSASSTSVNINISTAPTAPTVATVNAVCPGSSVTFTANSATGGITFNWYTSATGGSSIFTGNPFTTVINTDTSFYVNVTNATGCTSATRTQASAQILRALAAPVVTVTSTTATSVTFGWNAVSGATGYQVTLDGGTTFISPSSGAQGLTHTISNLLPNQTVSIQVKASGAGSCQTSPLSALTSGTSSNPLGNSIFIPNAFSPNGDGHNDYFLAYGTNIDKLEMRIFTQWGQMIFESKDKGRGWDGTYNGTIQPVGVYVYVIKATLLDGSVVTKQGSVNLIR